MVSAMQQFCAGKFSLSQVPDMTPLALQTANGSHMNDSADQMNLFFSSNFDFYFDGTM
jgi:hypothetical protein